MTQLRLIQKFDLTTMDVFRKSFSSMLVKGLGMVAGIGVSIFLGQTLGAEGLGIINLSKRIAGLLLILAIFGFKHAIVKHVAIAKRKNDYLRISAYINTSVRFNGLLAIAISLIGILLAGYLSEHIFKEPNLRFPFIIFFSLIIPQTISRIFSAALQGAGKIWQSQLVNATLSTWITAICLLSFYITGIEISIRNVAIAYAIGRVIVALVMMGYWHYSKPYKTINWRESRFPELFTMAKPLLLVSATTIIAGNADSIMLGWLCDVTDVGIYSIALRVGFLTSFFLQASNAAISPKIAALFANGEKERLRTLVQQVTAALTLVGFVSLIVFIVLGNQILALWGNEFTAAYIPLVILSVGQFINISTGCSGLLIIMCGYEKYQSYISIISVVANIILNYFMIIHYGITGAAIATAITVAGENIIKIIIAKRKVGILTTPLLFNRSDSNQE